MTLNRKSEKKEEQKVLTESTGVDGVSKVMVDVWYMVHIYVVKWC